MTGPTAEQPQVTATVSPAVPPRSRWGAIPRHLGRARTSTVVLTLLFLGIGALWLNIRPDPAPTAPASGGGIDQPAPVVPTTPAPTTEPVPTPTDVPTTTPEVPTTTSDVPSPTDTSPRFPTTTTEPPPPLPDATSTPPG